MKRLLLLLPAPALLALALALAACQAPQQDTNSGANSGAETTGSASSLVEQFKAAPADTQEFVNRSHAVIIGSISSVSEPADEPPYNAEDFAHLPESERPTIEATYYGIEIEEVLLDDGNIRDNARLRFTPPYPAHPQPNDRYIFALGRNPDNLSYGISATWNMLALDGDPITDLNGNTPDYGAATEPDLLEAIREAVKAYEFKPMIEWPERAAPAENAEEPSEEQ